MKYFLFISLFVLYSCKNSRELEDVKKYSGNYRVNFGGCLSKKDLKLTKVGLNLYIDQSENLYFRCFDKSKEEDLIGEPVFIQRFFNDCSSFIEIDTLIDFSLYDLKNYIDVNTFESIGENKYQDSKRLYFYRDNAGGGDLFNHGARSYLSLGKGFYRGSDSLMYIQTHYQINPPEETSKIIYREVPEIDIESFTCEDIDGYCFDKKNVYFKYFTTEGSFISIIEEGDLESFEIIEARFLAKDNQFVYQRSSIVPGLNPSLINSKEDFLKLIEAMGK